MISPRMLRMVSLVALLFMGLSRCESFLLSSDSLLFLSKKQGRWMPLPARMWSSDEPLQGGRVAAVAAGSATATDTMEEHRKNWINRSVEYYSKVMREERRRNMGQVEGRHQNTPDYRDNSFTVLAARHYFALRKIKEGKLQHAEHIYRRIIDELLDAEENDHECDHAKLAVTTLLLALLMQRTGASAKQTRSVFLTFFRVVSMDGEGEEKQCACSAKVVGAYSLFEMKQGNTLKSLQLARRALKLDPTVMHPLLHWKQFRDAAEQQQRFQKHASLSSSHPPSTVASARTENNQ